MAGTYGMIQSRGTILGGAGRAVDTQFSTHFLIRSLKSGQNPHYLHRKLIFDKITHFLRNYMLYLKSSISVNKLLLI